MERLPISFCIFVKDEAAGVRDTLECVVPFVSEIVVVDTGSTDGTQEICKEYTSRVYSVPFTDFGSIRTLTAHLATEKWVLMLDADERILPADWDLFAKLINQPEPTAKSNFELDKEGNVVIDSWALPRKRWADKYMFKQVEVEAYPDWQVRLFKNHPNKPIRFRRRIHETVTGCVRTEHSEEGPVIQHFQNVNKSVERQQSRRELYKRLYAADLAEGIEHSEPPISKEDE